MALSEKSSLDSIPETLLAMAKDDRYVRQCDKLLNKVLPSSVCPAGLSWLLYSLLVVRRMNKTLGMEFCGLSITDNSEIANGIQIKSDRLWKLMALSASISMAIDWFCHLRNFEPRRAPLSPTPNLVVAPDELRGPARREFQRRQRQAMLQRARESDPAQDSVLSTRTEPLLVDASSRPTRSLWKLLQSVKEIVKHTLMELSSSTLTQEGPHRLITNTQATETLSKWILRLVMAQFLLKGNFPVWNMMGIRLRKNRNNLLSNQPNLHRFVALILLQQAVTIGVQSLSRVLTNAWIRNRNDKITKHTLQGLDRQEPLITPSTMACSICKLPRTYPAAPSQCGHVFCWKCLYQWTSTVRHECPLCRTQCRPQDIIALYNYCPL